MEAGSHFRLRSVNLIIFAGGISMEKWQHSLNARQESAFSFLTASLHGSRPLPPVGEQAFASPLTQTGFFEHKFDKARCLVVKGFAQVVVIAGKALPK